MCRDGFFNEGLGGDGTLNTQLLDKSLVSKIKTFLILKQLPVIIYSTFGELALTTCENPVKSLKENFVIQF